MINIKLTDILDTGYNFTKNLPLGLNIASLLLFIFFSVAVNFFSFLPKAFTEQNNSLPYESFGPATAYLDYVEGGEIFDINLLEFTQIEVLGHFLYTYASIFLIILSLILLLAMLAIIVISKKNITNI
jgi:NADH-ubiquinone oxidoreductase chain 6